MKIIPKGQYGLITQSDNTRVAKPIIQERIPYKLKPNEFYFVDKKTGKKTLIKQKQETVSADNRTTNQRKQDQARTKQIQKKQEADKNYNEGLKTIGALTTLAMPSTYIGPVFNNNGKSYLDNVISGEGTGDAAGNLAIDLLTPLATGSTIKGGSYVYNTGNRLYNNWLDLKDLRNFMSRYQYNLINPKNSIIFNDSKLDRLFNHIVESHNTFTRGVDPYEAVKFGRFPEGSDVEEVARYSLTHIPVPTATNDAGLLPGEAALYTSNSIGLSQRYTNGNGYIGILRRPINYNFKTRRDFLHGNDFRFNPIPHNQFSITTDFPKDFKPWTIKQNRLDSRNPRKYLGRVPRYTLTPQNSFQVRANAGAFPIKNTNVTDAHFRHYLFIGSPNEQPLELIRMYPYKGPKGISDYDYTSVGLSHKK